MAVARLEIGPIEKNEGLFHRYVQILCDSGIMICETIHSKERESIEIYGPPPEENMAENQEQTAELILETPTDTIRTMELEALQLTADLAKTYEMAKDIKTKIVLAVENEWDETQDKALSNATKRSTAVECALIVNETYIGHVESAKNMDHKVKELWIEIAFQKRQFKREVGSTDDLRLITASLQEIAAAQRSTADYLGELTTKA
jgi:hypothetical protein